jgi:hypothetical protein
MKALQFQAINQVNTRSLANPRTRLHAEAGGAGYDVVVLGRGQRSSRTGRPGPAARQREEEK